MLQAYRQFFPQVAASAWVHPSAVVMGEVFLGEDVSIWPGSVLRGDQGSITIGEGSNIQDLSMVHATGGLSHTVIGARVTVGHRVILHGCTVMEDCLIGMGSILLDNCVIEPGCIIGAGALIPEGKRIPAGSLVLGMPGKVVRKLGEEDYRKIRNGYETYRRLKEEYRAGT
jgi:carbonic anhydrase/acetyltransferase-like protein (isoleucine patch superfamily)